MDNISKIKASYEFIAEEITSSKNIKKELFKSLMNLEMSVDDLNVIKTMLDKNYRIYPFGYRAEDNDNFEGFQKEYLAANIGSYFETYFSENMGLSWTSDAHTSELVDLIALGSGSCLIPKYFRNYELNKFLREALNI